MNDFDFGLAVSLVSSQQEFPVEFDSLWQWVGYSQKGHAKTMLTKNFEENIDFSISRMRKTKPCGGFSHLEHIIRLTIDAAKEFALLAQTENGKVVRKYFIEAESEYRKQLQQPKLPSEQKAVNIAHAIGEIKDCLGDDNPRLVQFLIDHAISDIMPEQKLLTGERLRGVVEIAEEMGLPVSHKNRSVLGKFVKKQCGHLLQEEKRLVNGTERKVCCYPDVDEVRKAIASFFS